MNWKPKKDSIILQINILKRVNVLSTGALLLLFTLVENLLKATVLFVVARIIILIDAQK